MVFTLKHEIIVAKRTKNAKRKNPDPADIFHAFQFLCFVIQIIVWYHFIFYVLRKQKIMT